MINQLEDFVLPSYMYNLRHVQGEKLQHVRWRTDQTNIPRRDKGRNESRAEKSEITDRPQLAMIVTKMNVMVKEKRDGSGFSHLRHGKQSS
jgi:hypothetical protein